MGTKQDCKRGDHTVDNQGLCWWCGTIVEPGWYDAYVGTKPVEVVTKTKTKPVRKSKVK